MKYRSFLGLRAALPLVWAAIIVSVVITAGVKLTADAQTKPSWGPTWTAKGELVLPRGYHEWVFLGSPFTPNALNDGEAGFPEFHNVYVQPDALKIYRKTGKWPEGTIMLKELQLTIPGTYADGSRDEPSGRGYFPGKRNGIDISVKDSKRFNKTNGWGFFTYGHSAPPYPNTTAEAPVDECAGCHIANATADMVFSKFYTQILNAK